MGGICVLLAALGPPDSSAEQSRRSLGSLYPVLKPNMLIVLPALVRLRQYRTLLIGLGSAALVSLPYFLTHPNGFDSFVQTNLHSGHFKGALTHAGNVGLWGGLVSIGAHFAQIPLSELSSLADLPLWAAAPAYMALSSAGSLRSLSLGGLPAKTLRYT